MISQALLETSLGTELPESVSDIVVLQRDELIV